MAAGNTVEIQDSCDLEPVILAVEHDQFLIADD